MSEHQLELFRSHTAAQDKYVYFLLAAAGAAIAVAVQRTVDSPLDYTQIMLGVAVFCWGISFYAGCKNRQSTLVGLSANTVKLMVEDTRISQAAANTQSAAMNTATRWFNRQFRFLILGAMLFLTWHVTGMWQRTQLPEPSEPAFRSAANHKELSAGQRPWLPRLPIRIWPR